MIAQLLTSTVYASSAQGDQDDRTWESLESMGAWVSSKERIGYAAYKFGKQHALDLDIDEVAEDTIEDLAMSSSRDTAVPEYTVI